MRATTPFSILVLWLWAWLLAALLCFTPTWFWLFNAHPIALDFIYSDMTIATLRRFTMFSMNFGPEEAEHLTDVKNLVLKGWVFLALLTPFIGIGFWKFTTAQKAKICEVALKFQAIWMVFIALIFTIGNFFNGGFKLISKLFHITLFPEGNWAFSPLSLIRQLYDAQLMINASLWCIAVSSITLYIAHTLTQNRIKTVQ